MMNRFENSVISLIRSALFGTKETVSADLDWNALLKLAKEHQIHALLYYGAVNSGMEPPQEIKAIMETNAFKNLAADRSQVYAANEVLKAFEEKGIEHMPLKGMLLKPMYPKSELRAMSDADILIKPEQYAAIRPLMQQLGYAEGLESDHEYVWKKENILSVELHKRLIPSYNRDYYAYYGDGWRLAKVKNGSRYEMTDEDQFIYLFTHFSKHYRDAGIGIRHFVDLYIYLNAKKELDFSYIEQELKKLQLDTFYRNVRRSISTWFEGAAEDEVTDFITDRIFGSGSYGTHTAHLLSAAVKDAKSSATMEKAHTKRAWRMIFPTRKQMALTYPVLEKHPVFLPFLWVYRWFRAVFFRRKTIVKMHNEMKITSVDQVENYQQELHFVGLDFNFKE